MSRAGLFSGTVTESAPADNAPTTKHRGHHWFQYGVEAPIATDFRMVFRTAVDNDSIWLPLWVGAAYNFEVNWGDGTSDTITTYDQAETTHEYATAGDYVVSIVGQCEGWIFNDIGEPTNSKDKIIEVQNWGSVGFKSTFVEGAFKGCPNVIVTATDAPDLSLVTSLEQFFNGCHSLTGDFSNWNTSTITNMRSLFQDCDIWNGDLPWNTSNVIDMEFMFLRAAAFNGNISTLDTGNVLNMHSMFQEADAFNSDISGWDVSKVTTMENMFAVASIFNQDISAWNVASATNMYFMLSSSAFSTANYDLLLNAWSSLAVQSGAFFSTDAQYTIATSQAARDILTDPPNSWTIGDGGGI